MLYTTTSFKGGDNVQALADTLDGILADSPLMAVGDPSNPHGYLVVYRFDASKFRPHALGRMVHEVNMALEQYRSHVESGQGADGDILEEE